MTVLACVFAAWITQLAPAHSTHNPKHGGEFIRPQATRCTLRACGRNSACSSLTRTDASSRPLSPDRMRDVHGQVEAAGQTTPLILARTAARSWPACRHRKRPPNSPSRLRSPRRAPAKRSFSVFPRIPTSMRGVSTSTRPSFRPRGGASWPLCETTSAKPARSSPTKRPRSSSRRRSMGAITCWRSNGICCSLAADRRPRASDAIRSAVRIAWLLHIAGDDGSNEQVMAATAAFRTALEDVADAFAGTR